MSEPQAAFNKWHSPNIGMDEAERRCQFAEAAAHLPQIDMRDWTWTDQDIDVLRKACAVRFDESVRTETLMSIAVAAMRILMGRAVSTQAAQPNQGGE